VTPPAAAAAAAPRTRTRPSGPSRRSSGPGLRRSPAARRLSGPLARPAAAAAGAGTLALPLGQRLARAAAAAPDHPLVGRMVRGRTWIGVLGFMLIGIVFMQVTLLQMNAGIGRAVEQSAALDRANGELRVQVSRLSSGERIQAAAARFGMITPVGGQLASAHSVLARDTANAVRNLRAGNFGPDAKPVPIVTTEEVPVTPVTPTPVNLAVTPAATGATGATATGATGSTGATAAPVAQAQAPAAQTPAPAQQQAPAQAAPVQPQQQAPVQQAQAPPQQQAVSTPAPTGVPGGGVTAPR
jgi:cell division protein FtsL